MLFWYIRHETAVYEIRIVMREGRNNSYLLDVCRGGNNSVRSLTGVGFGVIGKEKRQKLGCPKKGKVSFLDKK